MPRDYYPVLARAIAGLEGKTAEVRQAIYDHARAVLVRHMRDLDAGLSAGLGELHALEEAILKVESEAVGPERLKHVSIDESSSIAERAYLLWEQAGRPAGNALEHWLQAEAECSAEGSNEPTHPSGRSADPAGLVHERLTGEPSGSSQPRPGNFP